MKMEENSLNIGWFFLIIWLLFGQHLVTGFSLEVAKDENGVTESNNGKEIDLNIRMTKMEAKSLKQERAIEVLHILLKEEKKFSKQLSDRISKFEVTAIPIPIKSEELLGRSKRPYRLLPSNIPGEKENSNTDQSKQFFGPPTNCHEVGQLGYTLNGYYLIKRCDDSNENGKIGVVYCRFQQFQKTNPSLQESIGILDVKTKDDVHFYVQRKSNFVKANSVIPFELARLNKGGAMNLVSGIFTAPVTGIYHFQFTGVKAGSSDYLDIFLQVNGENVGFAYTDDPSHTKSASVISLTASLRLRVNDQVNLYKRNVGVLYDSNLHHTHFTGWLVEEELI